MAFSADGQILATNSSDGTVSLWDFTDPTLSRHVGQLLNAGANWVASADLAAERQTVATASRDGTVSLWDITDPAAPRRLMDYRTAHHVALTPDGRTLATAANQPKPNAPNQANHNEAMILLWDITDPASPRQLGPPLPTPPDWVSAMAFTHDGNTLTVASNDDGNGVILLWDITNRAAPDQLGPPLTAPTAWISSMALTSDGHILAAASRDGTVSLWDITDPAAPDQLGPPLATAGPIFSVAFTADERTLATGSANGTVNLWDITNPAAPRQLGPPLTGPSVSITSVMFAHDKDTLVTVSADASVISWDLNRLNRLRDHEIKNACIITGGGLDRDEWERYVPEGLSYRDTCANS